MRALVIAVDAKAGVVIPVGIALDHEYTRHCNSRNDKIRVLIDVIPQSTACVGIGIAVSQQILCGDAGRKDILCLLDASVLAACQADLIRIDHVQVADPGVGGVLGNIHDAAGLLRYAAAIQAAARDVHDAAVLCGDIPPPGSASNVNSAALHVHRHTGQRGTRASIICQLQDCRGANGNVPAVSCPAGQRLSVQVNGQLHTRRHCPITATNRCIIQQGQQPTIIAACGGRCHSGSEVLTIGNIIVALRHRGDHLILAGGALAGCIELGVLTLVVAILAVAGAAVVLMGVALDHVAFNLCFLLLCAQGRIGLLLGSRLVLGERIARSQEGRGGNSSSAAANPVDVAAGHGDSGPSRLRRGNGVDFQDCDRAAGDGGVALDCECFIHFAAGHCQRSLVEGHVLPRAPFDQNRTFRINFVLCPEFIALRDIGGIRQGHARIGVKRIPTPPHMLSVQIQREGASATGNTQKRIASQQLNGDGFLALQRIDRFEGAVQRGVILGFRPLGHAGFKLHLACFALAVCVDGFVLTRVVAILAVAGAVFILVGLALDHERALILVSTDKVRSLIHVIGIPWLFSGRGERVGEGIIDIICGILRQKILRPNIATISDPNEVVAAARQGDPVSVGHVQGDPGAGGSGDSHGAAAPLRHAAVPRLAVHIAERGHDAAACDVHGTAGTGNELQVPGSARNTDFTATASHHRRLVSVGNTAANRISQRQLCPADTDIDRA